MVHHRWTTRNHGTTREEPDMEPHLIIVLSTLLSP
ncbi:hypothetical protein Amir_0979 [Actinosynnema mirum DSM 43827]|uniref:Uncharacterized protein n=1 Tax=Actinosynnema mirum (strain ATCC 29888 / DSM 43827 / JCM 3225 / NBRC 14064 / NCIMB 13271 / NRRL B-12336 / IMRU 3971 / 101) TaxID=446462 RepID=C6WNL8_ACTMD|nr:hypothetical protein Amir_0979 [Actinosynnema mirum DSM 43827]